MSQSSSSIHRAIKALSIDECPLQKPLFNEKTKHCIADTASNRKRLGLSRKSSKPRSSSKGELVAKNKDTEKRKSDSKQLDQFISRAEENLNLLIERKFGNKDSNGRRMVYRDDIRAPIDDMRDEKLISRMDDLSRPGLAEEVLRRRLQHDDEDKDENDQDEDDEEYVAEREEFRRKLSLIPQAIRITLKETGLSNRNKHVDVSSEIKLKPRHLSATRKGPRISANDAAGKVMEGADGHMWESRKIVGANKAYYRWFKLK